VIVRDADVFPSSTPSFCHLTNEYPLAGVAVSVAVAPLAYNPAPLTVPAPDGDTAVEIEYVICSNTAVYVASPETVMVLVADVLPSSVPSFFHFTNRY